MECLLKTILLIATLTVGISPVLAQLKPDKVNFSKAEFGSLSEIRGKNHVYILGENSTAKQMIIEELQKYQGLKIVDAPEQANFFIAYIMWDKRISKDDPIPDFDGDGYITKGDFVTFTINTNSETKEEYPRVLLWGSKKAEKFSRKVKFNAVPPYDAVRLFSKAFMQAYGDL